MHALLHVLCRRFRKVAHCAIGSCLLGNIFVVDAMAVAAIESAETIQAAAIAFATEAAFNQTDREPAVRAGRLDPRLRLPRCAEALEAFRPRGGRAVGNMTVGVRCSGPKTWTLFVPVYVSIPGMVLVATRYVPRGGLLRQSDVRMEQRDLSRLMRGYFDTDTDAVGQQVKRALRIGAVVSPGSLAAPVLVRRGARVTILVDANGLEIRAAGKAMRDGAQGELVQVRNLSSKRVVEGTVDGAGVVRVKI